MTASASSVGFHIGVHKTATSHLQRSLRQATDALAEHGVRYFGPENFRSPGQNIPALFGMNGGDSADRLRTAQHQLAKLQADGHRLLLSEENYIGALNPSHGYAKKMRYGGAGEKISAFASAIAQDVDVYMAVRRPTALINSAYCQLLLGGQIKTIAKYQKRNPISSVNWLDLVSLIRAAKGVGRLIIWKYEDYGQLFPQIVAEMVGEAAAPHVTPLARPIHMGLSAAAVAEVLHRTEFGPIERVGFAARNLLPVEQGYPPFDGFSADEHALGDAAYAAQLKGISALEGVTLLQPQRV